MDFQAVCIQDGELKRGFYGSVSFKLCYYVINSINDQYGNQSISV